MQTAHMRVTDAIEILQKVSDFLFSKNVVGFGCQEDMDKTGNPVPLHCHYVIEVSDTKKFRMALVYAVPEIKGNSSYSIEAMRKTHA